LSFPSYDAGATGVLVSDRFINTFIAGEALNSVGLAVYLSAAFTVKRCSGANSMNFIGITMTKQPTVGGKVTVLCRGFARATAWGPVSAGDQLTTGPAGIPGTVQTDNSSKNTTIIGLALQAISSGGTGLVMLW
jgi:hypothetical protein